MTPQECKQATDEIVGRAGALAATVVERQYAEDPGLAKRWGERGRATSVRDAEYVLAVLAESIALGDGEQFGRQLVWLQGVLVANSVPAAILDRHLEILADVLAEGLSAASAAAAKAVLAGGRAALAAHRGVAP